MSDATQAVAVPEDVLGRMERTVTRAQMASFIARMIDTTGGTLPAATDRFPDDNGNPHEANINRLAAASIVTGRSDGSYGPDQPVTRAQMAVFLMKSKLGAAEVPPPGAGVVTVTLTTPALSMSAAVMAAVN